jgi:O-antigen/teichoic acid export membrane protein
LCLLFIPRFSIIGAAWAVLGGEVVGLIINNYFVFKLLKD